MYLPAGYHWSRGAHPTGELWGAPQKLLPVPPLTPRGARSWGIYSQLSSVLGDANFPAPLAWFANGHSRLPQTDKRKIRGCVLAVEVRPPASADTGRAEGSGQPGAVNEKQERKQCENNTQRSRGVASGGPGWKPWFLHTAAVGHSGKSRALCLSFLIFKMGK